MVSSHQLVTAHSLTRFARSGAVKHKQLKGLILAQNERWRRGLGMQVVRKGSFGSTRAAQGRVTRGYLPPGLG